MRRIGGRSDLDWRRARLAREQDGICPECALPLPEGLAGSEVEVDHIIPRARGGPDLAWNRQLVHLKCNRSKRFKLTDMARVLAAEHGVRLHLPIYPATAYPYGPVTQEQSLWWDWLHSLSGPNWKVRPPYA